MVPPLQPDILKRSAALHLFLLALAVCGVFGNSLPNGFVWDDNLYLVSNLAYRTFDLQAIFLGAGNGVEYLPVRDFSHFLDFALWGSSPWGFHLFNCLIYLATVVLVYFVTRQLAARLPFRHGEEERRAPLTAFAVALLFAVHPLHSEAVSWINCRNTLLSGLFFFAASSSFLEFLDKKGWRRPAWYGASFIFFVLALFSKSTAIALPLFLLVLYFFLVGKRWSSPIFLHLLPFAGASVAAFRLFTVIAGKSGVIPHYAAAAPFLRKLLLAVQIVPFYLAKFLYPSRLSVAYDETFASSFATSDVVIATTGIIAVIAGAVLLRRKFPPLLLWGCCYLALLFPVLNLFLTHPAVADRYAYLPLYPLCFLVVDTLNLILRRGKAVATATIVIAAVWGGIAAARNPVWRSDESLWTDAVTASPRSAEAHFGLGDTYFKSGRYEEALQQFEAAQKLDPRRRYHDFYIGQLLFMDNDFTNAGVLFADVLAHDPGYPAALFYAGYTAERLGEIEQAVLYFRRLVATREPDFNNLKLVAREKLRELELK